MKLSHLHLPSLTHYTHASHLQSILVRRLLLSKALQSSSTSTHGIDIPNPTILTAQFHPVYTVGRREIGTVSPQQQDFLRAGGSAEFHESLRGGQTTYHGPGQLVAYPILDLRRHGLTPRCYVNYLESVLIQTCARYGIAAFRTENTGVWTTPQRKIAAIGVALRRFVSSHGVALNVDTVNMEWWFGRIVACGLEGKEATSFDREGVSLRGVGVEEVGGVFVEEFWKGLEGVDGVEELEEREVLKMGQNEGEM
jgi:lipoate-protein ligase B